jgi:cysteinyl-tRNA synthetase
MHNGLVQVGEEKMSKSLGNLITIKDALAKHSADALRVFILSSQYRSPLSYSEEGLEGAKKGVERLVQAASREDVSDNTTNILDAEWYRKQFMESMDDDFNTAQALSVLFDLARDMNQSADSGNSISNAQNILKELARNVMGLKLANVRKIVLTETITKTAIAKAADVLPPEKVEKLLNELKIEIVESNVNTLIKQRAVYRDMKNFKGADEIRTRLAELGVLLEDTPKGTVWRSKR